MMFADNGLTMNVNPSENSILFDGMKSRVHLSNNQDSLKNLKTLDRALKGKRKLSLLPASEIKLMREFTQFN